jgi:hypothetical protein
MCIPLLEENSLKLIDDKAIVMHRDILKIFQRIKNSLCLRPCYTVQFFLQLALHSTLERCQLVKSVKNFRYVEKTSAECNEDSYLVILHLSRVELHCKLREKLHRVTWPLDNVDF